MEDKLWWKTTFGARGPSVEDSLWWNMTFSGRQPLVGDKLRGKTTLGGGRPLVEDDLYWKTTFVGSLHAAYSALRHFFHHGWARIVKMSIIGKLGSSAALLI